jgi:hypothetical protein
MGNQIIQDKFCKKIQSSYVLTRRKTRNSSFSFSVLEKVKKGEPSKEDNGVGSN